MFSPETSLQTDRLTLRPPVRADAPRIAEVANDKRIARNLTDAFPHPYSVQNAEEFIGSTTEAMAVFTHEPVGELSPGLIGVVGAHAGEGENADSLTFGYWFCVDAWGHGFATESAAAVVDHVIEQHSPRRIEAMVYGWNEQSAKVLTKLGFTLEGHMKNRVRRFGEVTDELVYARVFDN